MLQKGISFVLISLFILAGSSELAYGDLIDSVQEEDPGQVGVSGSDVSGKASGAKPEKKNSLKSSEPVVKERVSEEPKKPRHEDASGPKNRLEKPVDQHPKDEKGKELQGAENSEQTPEQKSPEEPKKRSGVSDDSKERQKMPVNFEGDELSGVRHLGTVELHSNVRVRQADLYMQSDQAKVFFDQQTDDVKKVEANGHVRMSKKDPKTGEMIRAQSEKVVFDALIQKITLIGKATLYRGKDVIKGEVIYYDLKTGWLKASKVKGVVQPENQSGSASE